MYNKSFRSFVILNEKILNLLVLANNGDYTERYLFHDVKKIIVERYGKYDGYDELIVEKRCIECKGSGGVMSRFNNSIPCGFCKGLKIVNDYMILERYKILDHLFHVKQRPGEYVNASNKKETFINKVPHPGVDRDEARKACIILAGVFDKGTFEKLTNWSLSTMHYTINKTEIDEKIRELKSLVTAEAVKDNNE